MRGMGLSLSGGATECLLGYDFPGNIRELRNIIERASVLTNSPILDLFELPGDLTGKNQPQSGETSLNLAESVARAEKDCILRALDETGGNKTSAAELLGISRKNLWEKMKLHKIQI